MSNNNENNGMSVFTAKKEADLPPGNVLSAPGDEFKLTDALRKEMLVWDTSTQDRKMVWLLAVKSSYGSNSFLQLVKDIEKSDYKLVRKAVIEPNLLNQLYDKRANADNQSANADDSTVVLYFEKILKDALLEKVSDIHF